MTRALAAALVVAAWAGAEERPVLKGRKACNEAVRLLDLGRAQEALEVLEGAAGSMEDGDQWVWWGNVGHCRRDLRQDEGALQAYSKSVDLNGASWFRRDLALLQHEFGRWEEARRTLAADRSEDEQGMRERLRAALDGPWRKRWPRAHGKREFGLKGGRYRIVSDLGTSAEEMDRIEAEAGGIDGKTEGAAEKLRELLAPAEELEAIARLMEATVKEFQARMGVGERAGAKGKVAKVFLFTNREEFEKFAKAIGAAETRENELGYYDPNVKVLLVLNRPGSGGACGLSSDTLDTLWHEAFHHWFHALTEQRPPWMNEGLAEFFAKGTASEDGTKVELGALVKTHPELMTRYERIRDTVAAEGHIPFREFFRMERDAWNGADALVRYAQAWSVTFWALRGDDEGFRKDYLRLFGELVKGRRLEEAGPEVFPDAKLDAYEKAWVRFVERLE